MVNFLTNFSPSAVLLDFGSVKIYWYGFLVTLAILTAFWLALKLAKDDVLRQHLWDLFFYLVIFGLVGARLYHAFFYNFDYFYHNPLVIFKVWQGGLAIHGSIIAGFMVIYFYTRKHKLSFWRIMDLLAVVMPLGQAIGRWGNYFNQELFGKPCNNSWCIPIDQVNRPFSYQFNNNFQPVFLYESILNLCLFVILLIINKFFKKNSGLLTSVYLIGYSVIRFFMEFLRLDTEVYYFGLKPVQWFCLAIIVTVIICQKFIYKHKETAV
jgi:phosphatidylglycerol---prolipoprotein diacylglyceryl transferase